MKRPILFCAISFSIGIALAGFPVSTLHLAIFCSLSIILAAILSKNNMLSHIFLYMALIFFGAAYCQNYITLPESHIANFISPGDPKVTIKGIVVDDPFTKQAFYNKEKISFILKATAISRKGGLNLPYGWHDATGLVKTDIYTSGKVSAPKFGDEIILEGKLSRPEGLKNPGLFDYSRYLGMKNIYAALSVNENNTVEVTAGGRVNPVIGWAYSVRRSITGSIKNYTDKRYSGFLNAILVGERTDLDSAITDDFVKTGTVHVIAISGLNIALVAGIFLMIFRVFGARKKLSLGLTSLSIVFYCFVAGSSPPVVRATVVFVIASLGYIVNRESEILNSLSLAAFLILLANPKELFDPSFQLSFGSVISIILFAPKIEEAFGKNSNYFVKSAAVSIAASIGVFPIVARYFNIISPVAVLANLVIVPALFVLTVASFIFFLFNIIGAAFLLGWTGKALSLLTGATFYINHIFARMPLASVRIPAPSPFFICAYYAILAYIFFAKDRKRILIAAIVALNIFVWTETLGHGCRDLKITFLDVGNGDSMIVRFPDRGTMLVDGGSGGIDSSFDIGKTVVAPYLWNSGIRMLDAVVVTHFHEDHLGGLFYILENFKVGCVIDNGEPSDVDIPLYEKYIGIVKKKNIRRIVVNSGDEITGFGAVKLYILNPPPDSVFTDPNSESIVIKLEYNKFSAIFTGDISSDAMERIIPYGGLLKSDVLKIPHHGGSLGKESIAERFFKDVSPEISVTSSGGRYRYRSKSKRLFGGPAANYDTKVNGAVTIISSGDGFKVEPFCPAASSGQRP